MSAPLGNGKLGLLDGHGRLKKKQMNKHNENNRARRLCAKLKNLFSTIKGYEDRIAAIQFNEEMSEEEKKNLIARLQKETAQVQAKRMTLEKRKKELAYEDIDPVPAFRAGATHFAPYTTVIPERASDSPRWTQISRRSCKAGRAFFSIADAYAA